MRINQTTGKERYMLTIGQCFAGRYPVSGTVYLVMLFVFAPVPLLTATTFTKS